MLSLIDRNIFNMGEFSNMGEITAVTSGKGGAGKTMFASNLAGILAMQGKKVLLIDMNTGFRNLDLCLGLESQIIFDIADVIMGICPLRKALIRDSRFPALFLLSASQICDKIKISEEHIKKLCRILSEKFDHIIIDAPSGMGASWNVAVCAADRVVIVMTQEYSSLRCNDTIDRKLLELGIKSRYAVLNRVTPERLSDSIFPAFPEISESTTAKIIGIVQEDDSVHVGMNSGTPAVCRKGSYITENFLRISSRLMAD